MKKVKTVTFWHSINSPNHDEEQLKLEAKNRLSPELGGGFGTPGSASAFVVAMMFYEPGTMQVEDAEQKLPSWLIDGYKEIFSSAIVQ